jgi:hypothetical protein
MRFISHSAAFKVTVLGEKTHYSQYGDRIVDREGYIAEFNQNDLNDGDVEFALKVFPPSQLQGGQVLMDEMTPAPFIDRLSVFDTDEEALRRNWAGETIEDSRGVFDKKEYIEDWLMKHSINHPDFRMIETIPLEPPWPRYLEYQGNPTQLLAKIESDGHDLHEVLRYEQQLGTRPQMIEILQQRLNEQIEEAQGAEVVPA